MQDSSRYTKPDWRQFSLSVSLREFYQTLYKKEPTTSKWKIKFCAAIYTKNSTLFSQRKLKYVTPNENVEISTQCLSQQTRKSLGQTNLMFLIFKVAYI